jgi:hypothetical protein
VVNHFASCLLNVPGFDAYGDVLVPGEFPGVRLPAGLSAIHRALFGAAPTRADREARIRAFLTVIEAVPEFAVASLGRDPRRTYEPRTWAATADPDLIKVYQQAGGLPAILAALETAGDPALAAVFGTSDAEPYRSYRDLWQGREPAIRRLGALLLAFAGRVAEELERGG